MDEQSKLVLERLHQMRGSNNISRNLIGGKWTEDSSFWVFKTMTMQDIGKWGELMFEESFGLKSQPTGLDVLELDSDIKTMTRAYERTKFSGGASQHLNPSYYYTYLIFPDQYLLYRIPSDDQVIKMPKANGEKGKIDITAQDLVRFDNMGYRVDDSNSELIFENENLEAFYNDK